LKIHKEPYNILHRMLYPITFSIPACKVVEEIPEKTKLLSSIIPGDGTTYIFKTEEAYYNEYKSSMFATTTKKSGWDCMRHYEIIANGCIPYFPNLEDCPVNTMALMPKELMLEGNAMYIKFSKSSERTTEELEEYTNLNLKLMKFLKANLTTLAMAKYVLERTRFSNVSSVLFLSGNLYPDYMRCLMLHGLKEFLGTNCHDFPKVSHMYRGENIDYTKLYGMGMSYSNLLEQYLHDTSRDATVEEDIRNKRYDIIIYGSYHRGLPFYNTVYDSYKPNQVIMLCGEDIHNCVLKDAFISRGHHIFIREM